MDSPPDRLRKLFHRRPCWMLAPLADALDYAFISVRRLLKQVGYFRSYTHNGKWYTLRDSPRFNREGLWHHKDVGFSKHGSLTATLVHLVDRSSGGLSARELAQKLQHPCHAVLTQVHHAGKLDRLRVAGEFRYLALEPSTNRGQRERATGLAPLASPGALSSADAVLVLVEHIHHPAWTLEQLAAHLQQQRQRSVTAQQLDDFFQQHGLKKTPPTPL